MAIECSYYLEDLDTRELPRRFLEAFAAILSHSNYAPAARRRLAGGPALQPLRGHLPGLPGQRRPPRHPL